MDIPLPEGFTSIAEFPRLRENLINMINIGGNRLVSRQGLTKVADGIGECRGQIKFQDELYQVSGTKLINIASDFTVTDISTAQTLDISGAAETEMAVGYTFLVTIVKNDRGYAYDGTTLSEISDPNFVSSIDVCYINGRWVFIPFDGGPAFISDALDPLTIPALGFFDAETQPDKNTGCANLKNRLYIFGEDTIEVFRDTGATPQPFVRIEGASIDVGLVAGKSHYKLQGSSTIVFLGKNQDQAFGVYAIGSGEAPKVSNEAVDELLNKEYSPEELSACLVDRMVWNGQDILVFRLTRHTLYFNQGKWGFFGSLATKLQKDTLGVEVRPWRAKYITHCYGEYFCGDSDGANIGQLLDADDDYGDFVDHYIYTFAKSGRGSYFTAKALEIDGLTGQITPEQTIGLSVSEDGLQWGPRFYLGLGTTGKRTRRVVWELMGGLGDYESFMGIRIQTTAPIEIACENLTLAI